MKLHARLGAALVCLALPAQAHVTANPDSGAAGAYFETALRISHGCDGAATKLIEVIIPDGVLMARPQAKPGWRTRTEMRPLDPPVTMHGKSITGTVSKIIWEGELAADTYDNFGILMKLPDAVGQTLWFKVRQNCGGAEMSWADIPAAGEHWHALAHPAPFVRLEAKKPSH